MPISTFSESTCDAAATLHSACFEKGWDSKALHDLLLSGAQGWIMQDADTVTGLLLIRPAADEIEILTIAVAPNHRRQGIAKSLLLHAMAVAPSNEPRTWFLEVRIDNIAAQKLYASLGFDEIAQRKNYYSLPDGTTIDAVIMQLKTGSDRTEF